MWLHTLDVGQQGWTEGRGVPSPVPHLRPSPQLKPLEPRCHAGGYCVHLGMWLSSSERHSPQGREVSEPGTWELCLCFHPEENTPLYLPKFCLCAWLAPLWSQNCNQTPLFFFFVLLPESCSNSSVSVHSISVPDYFQRYRTPALSLYKPFSKFILCNLVHLPSPRQKIPLRFTILHHLLSPSLSRFLVSQ